MMAGASSYLERLAVQIRLAVVESQLRTGGGEEVGVPASPGEPQASGLSTRGPVERDAQLRSRAALKLRQGALLTRPEAAAYLNVSTKKLQRIERPKNDGSRRAEVGFRLQRCPGLGCVVRYTARDVLRFASAMGKER